MPEDRRLAAIMFTDIVGYTALMGSDEAKAFQLLRKNRDLQRPLIKKYRGEWLKEMGDGILASFNTASDAVRCAGEIQNEAKKAGIPLRIGIHEGEVVFEGGDVLGDGVNVASRLEELAEEGAINISGAVYKDIKNKAGIVAEFVEDKELKNVDEPVKVYMVKCDVTEEEQEVLPEKTSKKRTYYILSGVLVLIIAAVLIWLFYPRQQVEVQQVEVQEVEVDKSIAVLPFTDMSPDKNQEYFCDGMMEEILMHLYKIGGLRVTSRTSVMVYKEQNKNVKEIAHELGVAHVLEGSIRKSGDRLRITVQLIDSASDQHIWAETYDRELADVFDIQSDIAKKIASALKATILPEVKERIDKVPTENTEAYNLYLQSKFHYSIGSYEKANQLIIEALSLDPNFAPAYSGLAFSWLIRGGWQGDLEAEEVLKNAVPLLNKSLELDYNNAFTHMLISNKYLWYDWDFENSKKEIDEAIRLSPSDVDNIVSLIDYYLSHGKFQDALELGEKLKIENPSLVTMWMNTGLIYYFTNQPEKSIKHYKVALELFPKIVNIKLNASRIYNYTGNYEEAITILENYLESSKRRYPRALGNLGIAYYHIGQEKKAKDILEELRLKSDTSAVQSPSFYSAMIYAQMGEIDLAFKWLEKAYENHEVEMYWLKVDPPFKPLHDDPRWQVMLDKVGFP